MSPECNGKQRLPTIKQPGNGSDSNSRNMKFNTPDYSEHGENWPGTCSTGKKQSPIDIFTWDTIDELDPFDTQSYFNEIEWELADQDELKFVPKSSGFHISGGNLRSDFVGTTWRLEQ